MSHIDVKTVPDLPAEIQPRQTLKFYNLELKLSKFDLGKEVQIKSLFKREYSSIGYGTPRAVSTLLE